MKAGKDSMRAAFAKDGARMDTARSRLKGNAASIAAFLSSAEPSWPQDALTELLLTHGAHHLQQIDVIAGGEFAAEAETWDTMNHHLHMIADALAAGIARHFPRKV